MRDYYINYLTILSDTTRYKLKKFKRTIILMFFYSNKGFCVDFLANLCKDINTFTMLKLGFNWYWLV